jgi:hypothetical protein
MEANHNNKMRTLSRPTILICVLWFTLCTDAFSNAGSNTFAFIMAIYVAGAWGVAWLIRLGVSIWKQRQGKGEQRPLPYWLFEPSVVVVTLALAFFGGFSYVRFALSEKSLLNYVEGIRAGKVALDFDSQHPARQIGLYTVTLTELLPDGTVRLITSSHGVTDRAGFANSVSSPPPNQGEDSYKHLHQQWWYWYESW